MEGNEAREAGRAALQVRNLLKSSFLVFFPEHFYLSVLQRHDAGLREVSEVRQGEHATGLLPRPATRHQTVRSHFCFQQHCKDFYSNPEKSEVKMPFMIYKITKRWSWSFEVSNFDNITTLFVKRDSVLSLFEIFLFLSRRKPWVRLWPPSCWRVQTSTSASSATRNRTLTKGCAWLPSPTSSPSNSNDSTSTITPCRESNSMTGLIYDHMQLYSFYFDNLDLSKFLIIWGL